MGLLGRTSVRVASPVMRLGDTTSTDLEETPVEATVVVDTSECGRSAGITAAVVNEATAAIMPGWTRRVSIDSRRGSPAGWNGRPHGVGNPAVWSAHPAGSANRLV